MKANEIRTASTHLLADEYDRLKKKTGATSIERALQIAVETTLREDVMV